MTCIRLADYLYEPMYNAALLSFQLGELQESFNLVNKALQIFPDHADSKELLENLRNHFSCL